MRNVSPIRKHIPGQSNTPMTYTGPPSQQELTRNRGRRDQSRSSFDFGFEAQPDAQIEHGAGFRRRRDMNRHEEQPQQPTSYARRRNQVRDEVPSAVVMDFSPPRSRSGSPSR
mmetsp:Transcript_17628/g.22288  ORF Transcript_17628/g.22288 Transcript_17628/m.22288 type:complete len:113 (+) Transcript_17628:112-450(+)